MIPILSLGQDETPTELGYIMSASISMASNSTFYDDVSNKTNGSFTYNESNFHCGGWVYWIVSSWKLKMLKTRIKFETKLEMPPRKRKDV